MASVGTYSKFVGRVGALAVALGIGSAIAVPAIAWADEATSGGATSSSDGSDSGDTQSGGTPGGPQSQNADPEPDDPEPADDDEDDPEDKSESEDLDDDLEGDLDADDESEEDEDEDEDADSDPEETAELDDPHVRKTSNDTETDTSDTPTRSTKQAPKFTTTAYTEVKAPALRAASEPAPAAEEPVVAAAEVGLPKVTVAVDWVKPTQSPPASGIRTFVLNVLGLFGFNPNLGYNLPVLESIWGAYRRFESFFDNKAPDFFTPQVLSTSLNDAGYLTVIIRLRVTDSDGDPVHLSTPSADGQLGGFAANPDGTFTYNNVADFTGTDHVTVVASDSNSGAYHFHNVPGLFTNGGHARTAGLTITVTPVNDELAETSAARTAAAEIADAGLPTVSATISKRSPSATRPSSPIRSLLLGFLGIFGFDPEPAPTHHNNPVLQGIWNAFRRTEAYVANIAPDFTGVQVLGTSVAADGRIAVNLAFDVSDYDGDVFSTDDYGVPNFDKNPDGTFTYYADAGFIGTTTVSVTAVDEGNHFHNFALWDYSGGHFRTAVVELTFTAGTE